MTTLTDRCIALLEGLQIADRGQIGAVVPLTGGVASDIAHVQASGVDYVVKFALPKLKVAADWRAPVHRNAAEYAWLQVASDVNPDGAVQLFGRSEDAHGFAMEFVSGQGVYLWKDTLLQQAIDPSEAQSVGDLLGRIHAKSSGVEFDATAFQNRDDFWALRIEPYLTFTAEMHPGVSECLTALANDLYDSAQVLVHGDVSPKNIIFRDTGPILLDAECATMGDASFDPAFCLNHLVLKAIHLPDSQDQLLGSVKTFWDSYRAHVCWETPEALEARVCRLLPALMLARVDGKSPVEYLGAEDRHLVREVALVLCDDPAPDLDVFLMRLVKVMKEQGN